MVTWLDPAEVVTALGADLGPIIDDDALAFWTAAARDYVEDVRPDLMVVEYDVDGVTVLSSTYTPTDRVKAGTVLLAHRLYQRRTSALGIVGVTSDAVASVIRDDPDVERMLGIGRRRKWAFGAPRTTTTVV